jgi:hypothetical protein
MYHRFSTTCRLDIEFEGETVEECRAKAEKYLQGPYGADAHDTGAIRSVATIPNWTELDDAGKGPKLVHHVLVIGGKYSKPLEYVGALPADYAPSHLRAS